MTPAHCQAKIGSTTCGRPVVAHGFCAAHYQREQRGVEIDGPLREKHTEPLVELKVLVNKGDLDVLKREAKATKRTLSDVVRDIIEEYVFKPFDRL